MASISLQIGLLTLALTCAFAWVKGGAGERTGATAVAITWVASLAVHELVPSDISVIALLVFDAALAAALLVVAVRYSSLWLGAAMLLQAFMLAIHAEQLGDAGMGRITYIVILNLASYAMLVTIMASTVGAWTRRAREQRQGSAPAPSGAIPAA